MFTLASAASTFKTAFSPVKSVYKEGTVKPVSSSVGTIQNAVTLGGQAEHASEPALATPSRNSGYLGALPRPVTQSLGGVSNLTGIPAKWLVIIGVVILALGAWHYASK